MLIHVIVIHVNNIGLSLVRVLVIITLYKQIATILSLIICSGKV